MDIKWIDKIKVKIGEYWKRIYLTELLFIIIVAISIVPQTIEIINIEHGWNADNGVASHDALLTPAEYKENLLKLHSDRLATYFYRDTDGFEKLQNSKEFNEKFKKTLLTEPQYISDKVGCLIINKTTGDIYTNREWLLNKINMNEDGEQVIKDLCEKDNVLHYVVDNSETFNFYVTDTLKSHNKFYYDKNIISNYKEIYFTRGESYDNIIRTIISAFLFETLVIILFILLIIKWTMFYKSNKKGSIKLSIKTGYLFLWLMEIFNGIKRTPIFIKRFKINVFDLFVFISWFMYMVFVLDSSYRRIRVGSIIYNLIGVRMQPDFATAILILYFLIRHIYKIISKYDETEKVIEQLEEIKKGNMELNINTPKDSQLKALISGINEIKQGYKNSIEEGIKNEKLKTELISNVSHDLRTPLTSIINYVDILQREDISEDERRDYVKVLENKSNRLKKLIDDLFEISKMNSGKVEIQKAQVDVIQLLYQSIGEYVDEQEERNVNFKIESPEELIMNLDGYRMSRVFQNIVSNAIKYSLENTRVYIKVEEVKNKVIISFKNVANYEMAFKENEVLERFARGDKSRNSEIEGSGLGLAIAKSIVELHLGNIKVEREGDMFKVYVLLSKNS